MTRDLNEARLEAMDAGSWIMLRPAFGPWDDEPDEAAFEDAGYRCRLWRNRLRVWCGYVEVMPDHPCHGQGRGDLVALDAHGGITYAGELEDWGPGWWIGFDCGHAYDLVPLFPVQLHEHCVYRTQAYVEAQTRALARELAAIAARQWV